MAGGGHGMVESGRRSVSPQNHGQTEGMVEQGERVASSGDQSKRPRSAEKRDEELEPAQKGRSSMSDTRPPAEKEH
eukprot:2028497-Lingulodinium_polyedra.AAC.1